MKLLTNSAQVYLGNVRKTYKLYKDGSAENHKISDDESLKLALIQALNGKDDTKQAQPGNVFRVKINNGKGYLVYKLGVDGPNSASIFHYHWNYNLDLPLSAT
jgi:hypothetical protein